MKKIIEFFKNLNVVDKFLIACVLIVTILLVMNVVVTLKYTSVFAVKEESGNNRWLQVEAIINEANRKVDDATSKIKELEAIIHELHKDVLESTLEDELNAATGEDGTY